MTRLQQIREEWKPDLEQFQRELGFVRLTVNELADLQRRTLAAAIEAVKDIQNGILVAQQAGSYSSEEDSYADALDDVRARLEALQEERG